MADNKTPEGEEIAMNDIDLGKVAEQKNERMPRRFQRRRQGPNIPDYIEKLCRAVSRKSPLKTNAAWRKQLSGRVRWL